MLDHERHRFGIMKGTLVSTLNAHPERNFIIDGWFSTYNWNPKTILDLQKETKRQVTVTCFYAPMETLLARTECETREDIITWYRRMAHFYRDELRTLPFAFRDFEREFTFTEYMQLVRPLMVTVSREQVISFIMELERQTYDRYYQTINLPYGISLPGYERTEAAWQIIGSKVDFRGKSVLDAGCYHNYCGRAAEDAGARRIVGLDRIQPILENAKRIGDMWGHESTFRRVDLDEWVPNEHFDIALCLNTIQYPEHPGRVIRNLFACADTVIMEAHRKFKKTCDSVYTHRLTHELPSPRAELERSLYFYERIP
jgi:2-polyprenyl-3-methyl-5-hydroxy-6-metoxy-1,4-benzoquinol methylase